MTVAPQFKAGDRVRFAWANRFEYATVQRERNHATTHGRETTRVCDLLTDEGIHLFKPTTDLVRVNKAADDRLKAAGPFMLRALEVVSMSLGQCPPGDPDHDLAMMVRKAIIMTREE